MQKEVIGLQCNGGLKEKYSNVGPFELRSKCTDIEQFSSNSFTRPENDFPFWNSVLMPAAIFKS